MALIKCPECGKEVSDSVRFCDNCGHKFSETVVDVVSEQNEPTQISGEIDTNAKKVKKKKLYCTNCGAVLNNFKRCDNCGIKAYNKARKYCRYCGKEMASSSKKCQFCGKNSKSSIIMRILSAVFVIISISLIIDNIKAMMTYNDRNVILIVFIAILVLFIVIVFLRRRLQFISRFCKKSVVVSLSAVGGIVIALVMMFSSAVIGPNILPNGSYFDDARWGMSIEEVRQITNRRISEEPNSYNAETGETTYVAQAYDLPHAKGKHGTVNYTFDKNNKLIKVQYFIKSPSITAMPMTKANLETDGWDLVESGTINKYTLEGNMVELASAGAAGIYGMYVSYEPKK